MTIRAYIILLIDEVTYPRQVRLVGVVDSTTRINNFDNLRFGEYMTVNFKAVSYSITFCTFIL